MQIQIQIHLKIHDVDFLKIPKNLRYIMYLFFNLHVSETFLARKRRNFGRKRRIQIQIHHVPNPNHSNVNNSNVPPSRSNRVGDNYMKTTGMEAPRT